MTSSTRGTRAEANAECLLAGYDDALEVHVRRARRDCSHFKLKKESCVLLRSRCRSCGRVGHWCACGWREFATRMWRFSAGTTILGGRRDMNSLAKSSRLPVFLPGNGGSG